MPAPQPQPTPSLAEAPPPRPRPVRHVFRGAFQFWARPRPPRAPPPAR